MKSSFAFLFCFLIAAIQGKPGKIPQSRIAGGADAETAEFPFQLSLQFYLIHKCGATVLNKDWALTAAHCVDGSSAYGHSLLAGSNLLSKGGTQHNVEEMVIHEHYNYEDSLLNDIAVLKVNPPFDIGGNVQPVTLPASGSADPAAGTNATIIGWGEQIEDGDVTDKLQKADNKIVDQAACAAEYSAEGQNVHDTNICAGSSGQGECTGDWGGPLLVGDTIYGIASFAKGCAQPGFDAVFTKVSSYRAWITSKTGV